MAGKTVRGPLVGKPKDEPKPVVEMHLFHTKAGHTQAPVRSLVGGPVQN